MQIELAVCTTTLYVCSHTGPARLVRGVAAVGGNAAGFRATRRSVVDSEAGEFVLTGEAVCLLQAYHIKIRSGAVGAMFGVSPAQGIAVRLQDFGVRQLGWRIVATNRNCHAA